MSVLSVPTKPQWDRQNEEEHRQQVSRDIAQTWKKNADLIIPFGKTLGFTSPSGQVVRLSIDGDGNFTFSLDNGTATALGSAASVTANATAIVEEAGARAEADTALNASLGDTNATVSTQGAAIANLEGASAIYDILVAATGSDPAVVRLLSGLGGSEISLAARILRLINTSSGVSFEVMRAVGGLAFFSAPVSVDFGGSRLTIGPGFGVSGQEVFIWAGPDTTAPSAQSRTNGYFAVGSDSKIYAYGAALVTLYIAVSPTNHSVAGQRFGAGSVTTSAASVTQIFGGNGGETYAWDYKSGDTFTVNNPTSASTTFTGSVTALGTRQGIYTVTVTDPSTGRTAFADFTVTAVDAT